MLHLNPNVCARFLLPILLGLMLVPGVASQIASAETGVTGASSPPSSHEEDHSIFPIYAQVITGEVPVYAHPLHATTGITPARSLGTGYLWVTLADPEPIYYEGQAWYLINQNEYVQADHLAIHEPSTFRGVALPAHPDKPFAWLVFNAYTSSAPDERPTKDTLFLPRYSLVTIDEEQQAGDWMWYRVGEDQWIEQRNVGLVKPSPRPAGIASTDKWIEVNLYEQTLAAYAGDQMVYATLISSGLPWWQTKQGLFRIWTKVKQAKMSGREGYPDHYFLEDVPHAMYFHQSFSLHGAYWHDRFGLPHSHGCVNLPLQDAQWLFDWVTPTTGQGNWTIATPEDPGTWVWVHD